MTDKNAIKVVSSLLQLQPFINSKVDAQVADIIKKYPYFIPVRYAKAAQAQKKKAFSTDMLTSIYPYTGNWLMFRDFIQGVRKPVPKVAKPAEEQEKTPVIPDIKPLPVAAIKEDVEVVAIPEEWIPIIMESVTKEQQIVADEEPIQPVINISITEVTAGPEAVINEDEQQPIFTMPKVQEHIFEPTQSQDYFLQQGIKIGREVPGNIDELKVHHEEKSKDKALMVVMSFTEWLLHYKNTSEKKTSEIEDQKAMRNRWQKEKLAAAMEEENDEIPENVFEMAVNSIAKEEGLASESLADIYMKQGKYDQAIEMYKKLSLRNPQKNTYFARKIEEILKEKRS